MGGEAAISSRRAVRARLVARLRARRAQIDEQIFARVSDRHFDRTGRDDPEYVAGLRAAGIAALDYVLAGVERWGEFLAPVPPEALAQARRAAQAGVGLETVLRRYIAGHAVLTDFVMQEAERGMLRGQGSELREILAIVCALIDRLSAAVSGAYVSESQRRAGGAVGWPMREAGRLESGVDSAIGEVHGEAPDGADVPTRRERILRAFAELMVEHGLAGTSVAMVVARARVSRRTLYQLFPGGLQDMLLAVLDMTGRRVNELAAQRLERTESWQEGIRGALAALLVYFDSEPALARVCLMEALAGGQAALERREAAVGAFREQIVAYLRRAAPQDVSPLMAESGIAAVIGVICTRLVTEQQGPLIELLGPLMGLVVTPFAASEQIVAEEARRGEELARAICAGAPGWSAAPAGSHADSHAESQPHPALPALLVNPSARRARQCLLRVAELSRRGHNPSNGEVAAAIGVLNKGQISRLLSQLQREGLLVKSAAGVGAPNAWSLTKRGRTVVRALADPHLEPSRDGSCFSDQNARAGY